MTKNDRFLRVVLVIIAVLLAGNLVFHSGIASGPRTAWAAGIPDSGAQFQAMIDQLSDLNKKIDKLENYLESGALTVKVKDPKSDKDK